MSRQRYIIVPVLFLFSGCTTLYVPSANHIHMMEEKGEVHMAGYAGNNGVTMQGGVSVTNHIGLVGTVQFSNFTMNADENRETRYYDGGLNYFRPVGDRFKAEIVLGLGRGSAEAEDEFREKFEYGEYTKLFLQANSSFIESQTEAGASLRLSHVRFTEFESTRNVSGLQTEELFIEPAAFLSYGMRNARLESQFGYAIPLSGSSKLAFQYQFIRLSIGARIIIN